MVLFKCFFRLHLDGVYCVVYGFDNGFRAGGEWDGKAKQGLRVKTADAAPDA